MRNRTMLPRPGAPRFFLGGRMFWGNDRLPLLEAALRGVALPHWW